MIPTWIRIRSRIFSLSVIPDPVKHLYSVHLASQAHPVHLQLVSVGLRLRTRRLLHVLGGRVQVRRPGGAPGVVSARRSCSRTPAATAAVG